MTSLNPSLADLVNQVEADLPGADPLTKISGARRTAAALSRLGDLLVGHYIIRAKLANVSWSQIGDAVGVSKQAAQQRWNPQTFELFTDHAWRAIVLSHEAARARRHPRVGTEHLLLGILGEPEGLAAQILAELAGPAGRIEAILDARLEPGTKDSPRKIPIAPRAVAAQEQSLDQALYLGHDRVGTEHLLLGVLAIEDGLAARVLGELDVDLATVRSKVAERTVRN